MRCWCDASDYWGLLFDQTKAAKHRLGAEGISIPYPQRDVHLVQETPAPKKATARKKAAAKL